MWLVQKKYMIIIWKKWLGYEECDQAWIIWAGEKKKWPGTSNVSGYKTSVGNHCRIFLCKRLKSEHTSWLSNVINHS